MRQITKQSCIAFENKQKFSKDNTRTDGTNLYLYDNLIAKWQDDGLYITNAGWSTNTTKERLNGLSGVRIGQEKGIWHLNGYKWNGEMVKVEGFTGNVPDSDIEKNKSMLKRIKAYSDLYLDKDIYPLIPSGGDCWYCCLKTDDKKPLGDATQNHEHLISHLEDDYVMGSLIVNAMREAGYNDMQISIHLNGFSNGNVRRAIYKYLKKRLTTLAR
jgi:hypothetical protein